MKTAIVLATVLLTAGVTYGDDALGSAFGTLSKAQVIGAGAGDVGLAVGIADMNSFVGSFAYGMSSSTEGRIKLGIADNDPADAELTFGMDFHYQMMDFDPAVQSDPLDMSVGGFLEYVDFDHWSIFQIGADLLGSYPFRMDNNTTLSPYGRFNVRLESYSNGGSDTKLKFGLSMGACWDLSADFGAYGEFQFDGNDGLFMGIRYRVL